MTLASAKRIAVIMALTVAATLVSGCRTPKATLQFQSMADTRDVLAPGWKTIVANIIDKNTADIYLSDRPLREILESDFGQRGEMAQMCHVRMFLRPLAGRTPIQATACNATIRHVIITPTASGEYAGAGFMTPRLFGSYSFLRASFIDGRARLIFSEGEFNDRLGAISVNGSINVPHDPLAARQCEQVFERLRQRRFNVISEHADP